MGNVTVSGSWSRASAALQWHGLLRRQWGPSGLLADLAESLLELCFHNMMASVSSAEDEVSRAGETGSERIAICEQTVSAIV